MHSDPFAFLLEAFVPPHDFNFNDTTTHTRFVLFILCFLYATFVELIMKDSIGISCIYVSQD